LLGISRKSDKGVIGWIGADRRKTHLLIVKMQSPNRRNGRTFAQLRDARIGTHGTSNGF
jgi:hypothetical protein